MSSHNLDPQLLSAVFPSDWRNPVPQGRYNLVVVGGGTAGLVTAAGAAGLGAKVALVERRALGGDCLNFGCVPSKALIASSRASAAVRESSKFGVKSTPPEVDFSAVMNRLRTLRSSLARNDSAERFCGLGVDVFLGDAVFESPRRLSVEGQTLVFKRAALCTGTRPRVPDIPGLLSCDYLTNETVFSLDEQPRRLAVLGGGPIGCELAQAFARLGSEVTLIQAANRLLTHDDPMASRVIAEVLRRDGVTVLTNAKLNKIQQYQQELQLEIEGPQGLVQIHVSKLLVAVGRTPNVEGLNLERAGVAYDSHGVKVDRCLRTTVPAIFAAGDICTPFKFTHVADAMARIVVRNALFPGWSNFDDRAIPWCTYTSPEVAHVGLTEELAAQRGVPLDSLSIPFSEVDRTVLDGESDGFATIRLRRGSDTIVGATVVAPHAGEMISEMSLAMKQGVGLKAIGGTIHPYPTCSEVFRKLADQYNRGRLKTRVRGVLSTWFRWHR